MWRSGRGSEETVSLLCDGREEICQEQEEEELTVMSRAHKAKKRKQHYGVERIAVIAPGIMMQRGTYPSTGPTQTVVPLKMWWLLLSARCNLPPGTDLVMVQASRVVLLQTANKIKI